ncbi:putative F420-0 ABC transporter substrate-binding protein [Cellulomonas fengjieae]|uniref:F420-0 ABC transporter substrate-binding protein n=1 Tax=Cellulomonas fengjieae TaxID=2819978 RepID=A0ABS3SFF4_9CELL|nr:putative F420-0 ABC transporter substrate-binding protein [Cellulomonas fengjieae]MBO3084491.1 putative F420-0 ABC transporter substrate-binding protein [Cellulomonas fengjieae]QVI67173.1 putative F420-0 ABC transporter substrate-binding protein [Cellulomonas fengjieae]
MRSTRLVLAGTVVALALAACSSQSTPEAEPTTTASEGYTPVTLDNCGTEVTLTAPPQRVVTIKSTATEMLLALGLQDVMIGTAFADGPVPQDQATAYEEIPVVSEKVPGQEALLGLGPDFVYGGWESNFSADGAGHRATLQNLGITTYVSPAACQAEGYVPDPLTFDEVADEIREVAAIFGVPGRAEELVAQQDATLASVEKPTEETTALWYSSGSDIPYVGAGIGAPQMIMDAAGLTNIFADVHDSWTSAGWEQVVAADPDVIVLVDAAWNSAEKKIGLLEANPATSQLTAVQQKRYLTVPFAAGEAGVRNADAVASLADQLAELG